MLYRFANLVNQGGGGHFPETPSNSALKNEQLSNSKILKKDFHPFTKKMVL